jgi:hypothetical protein
MPSTHNLFLRFARLKGGHQECEEEFLFREGNVDIAVQRAVTGLLKVVV